MNSEGDKGNQKETEAKPEGILKSMNSQSMEHPVKSTSSMQLLSKTCGEQLKLNNNIPENSSKNSLPLKNATLISNGRQTVQSSLNCCELSDQSNNGETSKSNAPLVFGCSSNIKTQNASSNTTAQLKHKTVLNMSVLSLPKSQMNLSSTSQTAHTSHTFAEVSYNCNSSPHSLVYVNSSISNSSSILANSTVAKPNEDIDMKNNVDYISGIEKCPSKVSCSSDSSPEAEDTWAMVESGPKCILNNIGSSIGSTSQGTCCFLRPNINGNCEVAGPSGLQKNFQREHIERRDSSSGNEGDMSDGEDCCIYTYKGNNDAAQMAQENNANQEQREDQGIEGHHHSGRSSPEMDFLEMDFDPGPSCEQDTGDSDLASINEDIQNITLDNADPEPVLNDLSSGKVVSRESTLVVEQNPKPSPQNLNPVPYQQCSNDQVIPEQKEKSPCSSWMLSMPSTSAQSGKWESTGFPRSNICPPRESYEYHSTSGDLISLGNNRDSDSELWGESSTASVPESSNINSRRVNLISTLYHRMMAKKLMLNKEAAFNQSGDSNLESELSNAQIDGLMPIEKVMLWSEQEATVKQVTQIGTSACGATSAINALLALNVPFSLEALVKGVGTRLREPGTSLPRYLLSRSLAGSTHKDLARGISLSTNGTVITKFFPFYPERKLSLSHWLHYWISRGAAPIATLNLQQCGKGCDIPDAWHHQMIFGVGQAGIYLTNPLECLPEQYVWHQLVSPSILLVRRSDVLAHWIANPDLKPLASMGHMWRKLNVLGQVVNMVREAKTHRQQASSSSTGTTHIRIPASYAAGITLVMSADSAAAAELLHAEELPLL